MELERLSLTSGIALALASITAFFVYAVVIKSIWMNPLPSRLTFQVSPEGVQSWGVAGITPPSTTVVSATSERTMKPTAFRW